MHIGSSIRALRQHSGMTQEQVASQLKVSCQAVSKWETGANTPDISLLPSIAALFGVTIDSLFSPDPLAMQADLPQQDDEVIRIIQMRGRRVLAVTPVLSPDSPPIEIAFPRNCNDRTQYFRVEVHGHVMADGSINGDVVCHQSIQCGQINGDVRADGDIRAYEVTACGRIVCSGIHDCFQLQADSIECTGSINAANLTCDHITCRE